MSEDEKPNVLPSFVTYEGKGYNRAAALKSVGEGWASLIHGIYNFAEKHAINIQVQQVKEKFGTLRFYYSVLTPTIPKETWYGDIDAQLEQMVDMAEYFSGFMCEGCGAVGTQQNNGWIKTRCAPCQQDFQAKWQVQQEKWNAQIVEKPPLGDVRKTQNDLE